MKKLLCFIIFTAAAMSVTAENITLPPPRKSGSISVQAALSSRRSVRKFADTKLDMQTLSDLLWCANGVSGEKGKRTAPSAMDRREVMIYAAFDCGTYCYDAEKHRLIKINASDIRSLCGRYKAPCYLILVPNAEKQESEIFRAVDTGYVSQNIYLAAEVLGLGTCAMGSVADRKAVAKILDSGSSQPLLVHPVGIPAK